MSHNPNHVELLVDRAALVDHLDIEPSCVVGNEPASRAHGHQPCANSAIWAFRTHEGMGDQPTGNCPGIILVCEDHLTQLRDGAEHNIRDAHRKGKLLHCKPCSTRINTVEDLIWGIERLKP